MNDDELSALIRQHASRHRAGPALRAALRTRVALNAAAEASERPVLSAPPAPVRPSAPRAGSGGFAWPALSWPSALAGAAAGVMLVLGLQQGMALRDAVAPSLGPTLIARHVQALGPGPLLSVLSSDRHTVKPWFQGRVDFAPPVQDLAELGFPLLGARVDHLGDQTVAALVYGRRLHRIELFVWPDMQAQAPEHWQERGFQLRRWTEGGMAYALISDLAAPELDEFMQQWRERQAATPALTPASAGNSAALNTRLR